MKMYQDKRYPKIVLSESDLKEEYRIAKSEGEIDRETTFEEFIINMEEIK